MRSQLNLSFSRRSGYGVDVCIAPPHQFVIDRQQELLGWKVPISYLIVVLQQSAISLNESNSSVIAEKDRLRNEFIRFGSNLVFSLRDLGYVSDLFDPRSGYPLQARPNITLDDNATVKALLYYPVVKYQQCSLIVHPRWQTHVYPSTIATSATLEVIKTCLRHSLPNITNY